MDLTYLETTYTKPLNDGSTGSHFIAVLLEFCGFLHKLEGKRALLHTRNYLSQLVHRSAYLCASLHKSAGSCAEGTPEPSDRPDLGVERGVAG